MARSLSHELDVKCKDLLSVFPESLIVDFSKRGREFPPAPEKIRELADDILKSGQLQPVSVTINHEKKLVLVAGFTRYESILLINSERSEDERIRIECKVIDGNAEEMFLANISENRLRNETSAIDDAFNIRRLEREFAKTDAEIRSVYGGKSQAWLDQMRKLLTLSRAQQKQIHEGQLSASVGFLLADMAPEEREAVVERAKTPKGKVTTAAVLQEARKSGTLAKQTALRQVEVNAAFAYLQKNDKSTRVVKFADAYLKYVAGTLPEPDFFGVLHKLLNDK